MIKGQINAKNVHVVSGKLVMNKNSVRMIYNINGKYYTKTHMPKGKKGKRVIVLVPINERKKS